ncbi:MAG: Mitochondrial inner membrane protein oxa1 [Caeruleum heppii]|nr:MAG: Mitochondrial inner membrane protein oxa1 [Caeruleum heppii]
MKLALKHALSTQRMLSSQGSRWQSRTGLIVRHWLKDGTARRRLFSSRPASTAPLSRCVASQTSCQSWMSSSRPRILSSSAFRSTLISTRLQSTTPPILPPATPPPPTSTGAVTNPDAFTSSLDKYIDLKSSSADIHAIPEHIGYLKELGLDYGWGPTAFVEVILEHIHVYTGSPWWLSITLTAVALRLALLKPYIGAADASARMMSIRPLTEPLTAAMRERQAAGDRAGVQQARLKLKQLYRDADVKMYKAFVPLLQVFLGFGSFRLMRGMADLPVPGLEHGGVLWFPDLTVPDPLLLLPIITGALFHVTARLGGDTGAMTSSATMRGLLLYFLPVSTALIGFYWPAALQLTFVVASTLSLVQASIFRVPLFRRKMGIAPVIRLPSPQPMGGAGNPSPYSGTLTKAPPPGPGPTSSSEAGPPSSMMSKPRAMVKGAMSEMRGMRDEVSKTVDKYSGSKSTTPGGKSRAEISKADAYEEKRRKEEERKRWELVDAQREARRLKKKQARRK